MDKKISSILIVSIVILVIFSIPFIPKELFNEFGPLVLLAPVGVIIAVIIVILILSLRKKTVQSPLESERKKIFIELKEAEKEFLKHKIDKATFDSISQEKNFKLIKIEAEIDSLKKIDLPKDELKKAELVSADKKKVLLGLLEQKQRKVHELKIAEQSYLKRKIDENSFKNISNDLKKEIISIESQIKAIQESEEIEKLKEQLKEGAREISRQKKSSTDRQKPVDSDKDDLDELADLMIDSSKL
jgi:hypothetical protein